MALAAGMAACGSTATASTKVPNTTTSTKVPTTAVKPAVSGPAAAPTVDCGAPNQPPKNMPPKPVADNCWAGGFYLGTGSFHNRKIIYADKAGNSALFAITPQLVRTNPHAAATLEKAAAKFVTSGALGEWMPSTIQQAKAGDKLVSTGINPSDPTGLHYAYTVVLTGGVSAIPGVQPIRKFAFGSTAQVGECINNQVHVVDPAGKPVNNINGYTGWMKWTDILTKTSAGWKISRIDIGLSESKTPCQSLG